MYRFFFLLLLLTNIISVSAENVMVTTSPFYSDNYYRQNHYWSKPYNNRYNSYTSRAINPQYQSLRARWNNYFQGQMTGFTPQISPRVLLID